MRGRSTPWLRRGLLARLVLPLGAAPLVLACERDPKLACTGAYQHLVTLAKRNADPDGEAKFVGACTDAWDPKRVECLETAKSVGEALACKPVKKRPG